MTKAKKKKTAKKKQNIARKSPVKRMSKTELKKYKEILLREREKVGGDLSHIAENTLNKSQRDASGDLSGYSYHMADMASDDYERDFSLGRATDEQKRLYLIDEAIKRIEEGTYGLCLQCGKMIAKKRLSALPYTEMCIDCQKKKEG
ncbi:MAG: TraR/DksA C4-type zinc finger protein [Candidatus Omnitrophica bacterium]|nr:TraR/DksA C4-type zinc finger protein [Candidatus Omnitrophota bacterium]